MPSVRSEVIPTRRALGESAEPPRVRSATSRDGNEPLYFNGWRSILSQAQYVMPMGEEGEELMQYWNMRNDSEIAITYYGSEDRSAFDRLTRLLAQSTVVLNHAPPRQRKTEVRWDTEAVTVLSSRDQLHRYGVSNGILRQVDRIVHQAALDWMPEALDSRLEPKRPIDTFLEYLITYKIVGHTGDKKAYSLVLAVEIPTENRFPQVFAEKLAYDLQLAVSERYTTSAPFEIEICEHPHHDGKVDHPPTPKPPKPLSPVQEGPEQKKYAGYKKRKNGVSKYYPK